MQGSGLGPELQWGGAARCRHPLLALLDDEGADEEVQAIDQRFAHGSCITALAVTASSGGPVVLSADDQGCLKLWRLRLVPRPAALARAAAHTLHSGAISCLEVHAASGKLATAGDDGCMRVFNLPRLLECAAGQHAAAQLACLAAHCGSITSCCFSSCGRWLASCAMDGTVRLWSSAASEPLAVLQLAAASVAFAPGNDAALLVAATRTAPQLLDLSRVPACKQYCAELATAQAASRHMQQHMQQRRRPTAVDPFTAVWLPTSPGPQPASAATGTPRQLDVEPAIAGHSSAPGSSSVGSRWRGGSSAATFGRRRRRRQEEAAAAEEEEQAAAAEVATEEQGAAAAEAAAGSSSWLPDDTPVRPPRASGSSHGLFGPWATPQSPTSPLAADDDGCVPSTAVAARYEAPAAASSGGGVWDAATRSFIYEQGGHASPVCWAAPLPAGLHVLTAATDGEAKLWPSASSSSSSGACCTLLPGPEHHAADCFLRCRPVVAPGGHHVVCGGPSGTVAVWVLQQLQRTAHLPLNAHRSNAAAAMHLHQQPVTAVAVGSMCGEWLLASGDASGRLHVRWR